jgi:hypothetical protein
MSHIPAAALQTAVDFASTGQFGPLPVHISVISHTPCEDLQTVLLGSYCSIGQSALFPGHVSAISHIPVAALHTSPL